MVTFNLLRSHNGLREKFFQEAAKRKRRKVFLVRFFLLASVLLFFVFGLSVIKERFFLFLKTVDEQYGERVEFDHDLPGLWASGKAPEKVLSELDPVPDPGRGEKSLKTFSPELSSTAEGETQVPEKPAKRDVTEEAEGESGRIRVATIIVKSNASVLETRLKELGFSASVEHGDAVLPFYSLSYLGIEEKDLKTVLLVLKKHSVKYITKNSGTIHNVHSEKIFLPLIIKSITSELQQLGISGQKSRGRARVKVFKVFLDGFYGPRELEEQMSRLNSFGFSPIAVTVK